MTLFSLEDVVKLCVKNRFRPSKRCCKNIYGSESHFGVDHAHMQILTIPLEHQQIAPPVRAKIHSTDIILTCNIPTSNSTDHCQTELPTFEKEIQIGTHTTRLEAPKRFYSMLLVNASFLEDYNNFEKNIEAERRFTKYMKSSEKLRIEKCSPYNDETQPNSSGFQICTKSTLIIFCRLRKS